MNERDALLRAVCESPDDDTPRLVFADWLQEHGEEERAELIRTQVGLTRGGPHPDGGAQLKQRELRLLLRRRAWKDEVPGAEKVRYARGFICHAHFPDAADFLRSLGRAPLRSVVISGAIDLAAVMSAVSAWRIAEVDLGDADISVADFKAFAEANWSHVPDRLIFPWYAATDELRERLRSRFGAWVQFQTLFAWE